MPIIAITLICLLISVIGNIFFWGRTDGISMPIFVIIVIPFILGLKRINLSKAKLTLFIHLFIMIFLSVCVVLYRNRLILFAAIPTIFASLAALVFAGREGYSFPNALAVVERLIINTLSALIPGIRLAGKTSFNKSKITLKIFLGILIAIPFLIIFARLFASADLIFKTYLTNVLDFIWRPELLKRSIMIIFMWFLFCGYLARTEKELSLKSHLDLFKSKQNYDGIIVFVFLLLNNLLFLSFIIIQLKYLFGGVEIIRNTSFTYAEYVHRGFYEFWATIILVSTIVIVTNYKLREQEGHIRRMVESAQIAMSVQTFVIIASGLKRIFIYEEAYGYTYLRILVALFMLWMAGVFVFFILKIILKKSLSWIISSGLCLAFVFLLVVSIFSIDRFIAQKNIDRYLKQNKELDMKYLSSLSTDTYPEIKRLEMYAMDENIRQSARTMLHSQCNEAKNKLKYWSSWNYSLSQAARDN